MSLAQLLPTEHFSPSVILHHGRPATTSLEVAKFFSKRHDHVLRDIDTLLSQLPENSLQPNFGEMFQEQETPLGLKQIRIFILHRDGFMLLVMGYTGKKALAVKLAYIEAFNRLEAELALRHGPQRASLILNLNARKGQRRVIRGRKRLKLVGRALCAAVAAQQNAVEVDADLMDLPGSGNEKGAYDIVSSVASDLPERNLRASENHGL